MISPSLKTIRDWVQNQFKNKRKATPKLLYLAQQKKWKAFIERCKSHPGDASYYNEHRDPDLHLGYVLHYILRISQNSGKHPLKQRYDRSQHSDNDTEVPLDAIKAVIDAYPSALYHKNKFDRGLLFLSRNHCHWNVNVLEFLIKKYMPPSIDELQQCLLLPRDVIKNHVLPYLPNMALDQDKIGHTVLHSMLIEEAGYDHIHTLLKLLPELATIKSASMRTPLHIACYCDASLNILNLLYDSHPSAIEMKDRSGKTPTEALLRLYCN